MTFKLIIADVDGCLVPETSAAWDFEPLAQLVRLIRAANAGESQLPPLTLCTGRPQPYVEALMKVLDIRVPAICESGAILYSLSDNRARYGPKVTPSKVEGLRDLRRWIEHALLRNRTDVVIQAGKEAQISLYCGDPAALPPFQTAIEKEAEIRGVDLDVSASHYYLNLSLKGVDKGAALRALLKELRIDAKETAAVGDTIGDISLRDVCSWFAAPANAQEAIRKVADYVSPHEDTKGFSDILENLGRVGGS
jgi:HAD superfamily hydrolase (TIGR01484 family)